MSERVDYLYEPDGAELHWDGLKNKAATKPMEASLSGAQPQFSHHTERQGLIGTQMAATKVLPPGTKAQPMALTHDQLMAKANEMLAAQKANQSAQLAAGASTGDRDDAGGVLPHWLRESAGR